MHSAFEPDKTSTTFEDQSNMLQMTLQNAMNGDLLEKEKKAEKSNHGKLLQNFEMHEDYA